MHTEVAQVARSYESRLCDEIAVDDVYDVVRRRTSFQEYISSIVDLLKSHQEFISSPRENFEALDTLIEHVESRIFYASDVEELIFDLRHQISNQKLIQDAYCGWETALEQIFTEKLCSGRAVTLNDYRLANRLQRVVRREISMLHASPKRILFVGSGPFPISSIWLNRILGVPVDGLDLSENAVNGSRELVDKLGLEKSIRIIHEESSSYDVSMYDLIVIALLAKPKGQVLHNIFETAAANCKIICRTSFGLRRLVYEPTVITQEILDHFTIDDMRVVTGPNDDLVSSLALSVLK